MSMIQIPDTGEVVEITRKKKRREDMPPYSLIGNGRQNRTGQSLSIFGTCAQLNQSEISLLSFLLDEFTLNCIRKESNPNIIVPTSSEDFTDRLKLALKKNYAHLEYLEVVIRMKRGVYMVSPLLMMYPENYSSVLAEWLALVNKVKSKEDKWE